jgi:hypothetical protein
LRDSGTEGVEQNRPRFTPLTAKRASRDQLTTRRRGDAVDARDHGYGQAREAQHHSTALFEEPLVVLERRLRAHLLEIMPGAERLAGRGENHDAQRGVLAKLIELPLQRAEQSLRQGVERLRPVERQGNYPALVSVLFNQRLGQAHWSHLDAWVCASTRARVYLESRRHRRAAFLQCS